MRWNPAKAGSALMFLLVILSGCIGARGPDCSERIVVHVEWMDPRLFDLVKPPGPPGITIQSGHLGQGSPAGRLNESSFSGLNQSPWLMGLAKHGFDFVGVTYFGEDGEGPAFNDFHLGIKELKASLQLDKRVPEAQVRREFTAFLQNVTAPSPQDEADLFRKFWGSENVGEVMFGDKIYDYSVALPNASGVESLYLREESQGLARPLKRPFPGVVNMQNTQWGFFIWVPALSITIEDRGTTRIDIDAAGQVILRNFNYDRTFADTYRVLNQTFQALHLPMPPADDLIVWKSGDIRCPPEPIA